MTVSKTQTDAKAKLVRVTRAAKEIGIAASTTRRLIAEGRIKAVVVGARTFVPVEEIARIAREGA